MIAWWWLLVEFGAFVALFALALWLDRGPSPDAWHLKITGSRVIVQRRVHRGGSYDIDRYKSAIEFEFDPSDVESRATALTAAEECLDALRDMERRAVEVNAVR